ncbi:MAG: PCRF domain-containing protein, partial [Sandarakinorhabdus sp.]|nr:PCRF domain-containing protein [Sandarakinorhabdus sp.]
MLLADKRLLQLIQRHEALAAEMANPALVPERFVGLSKDYAELTPAAEAARALMAARAEVGALQALAADAADPEMRAMAAEELEGLKARLPETERALALKLLQRDAADPKPAIVEIRAGTGGDEAALFAGDLARMYQRYAELRGWRVETLSASPAELGGFKEIV